MIDNKDKSKLLEGLKFQPPQPKFYFTSYHLLILGFCFILIIYGLNKFIPVSKTLQNHNVTIHKHSLICLFFRILEQVEIQSYLSKDFYINLRKYGEENNIKINKNLAPSKNLKKILNPILKNNKHIEEIYNAIVNKRHVPKLLDTHENQTLNISYINSINKGAIFNTSSQEIKESIKHINNINKTKYTNNNNQDISDMFFILDLMYYCNNNQNTNVLNEIFNNLEKYDENTPSSAEILDILQHFTNDESEKHKIKTIWQKIIDRDIS